MSKYWIAAAVVLVCTSGTALEAAEAYTPGQPTKKTFAEFVQPTLKKYCVDCHSDAEKSGGLSLEKLGPVDELNEGVWKTVWAQVTLQEMPPREETQPSVVERLELSDWIVGELKRSLVDRGGFNADTAPEKGNFVDHNLLFGPLPKEIRLVPTSTPTRLWRVTPLEHLTRLNELINLEPEFDKSRRGARAHGDAVPFNHGGEFKLYFGLDNITYCEGGGASYATAVKALPEVLSSPRDHGLDNYSDLTSVNSAESTQIVGLAKDIIRYMAYGPLSIAEPWQVTKDTNKAKERLTSNDRGLPTCLIYSPQIKRPLTPVYDLMKEPGVSDARLRKAVDFLFEALAFRPPNKAESDAYLAIVNQSVQKLGKEEGVPLGFSAIFLDRDALFRPELVQYGKPDPCGRVMLQDWELGLAVNHALRYLKPDESLRKAIVEGRMRTKADVKREVERVLADEAIRKPRVLQFFRDYFDYDHALYVCKDSNSLRQAGVAGKEKFHYSSMRDAAISTDRLVEYVLESDKDVLKQLLTTDKVFAGPEDSVYFGTRVASPDGQIGGKKDDKKDTKVSGSKTGGHSGVETVKFSGPKAYVCVNTGMKGPVDISSTRTFSTVPEGERLGILTHPSWLVSHSDAMDNHAIHRGRWILEHLLGGGIPDVPITVNAMLPDEPENTLRDRMRVTRQEYCWTCHKKMDPLGLPFELYNHVGLYRSNDLGKPVDATGEIIASGVPGLDGKVKDGLELIQKLSASERSEQVFVRYAFRFWMGRNETLNDRQVIQDAYNAYKTSGGSMKALITSLLTSDAFLYRTRTETQKP